MPGPVKGWSPVRGSWFVARGSRPAEPSRQLGQRASRRAAAAKMAAAHWDNGRLVRCTGRTLTVHGTGETPVLPVNA